MVIASVVSGGGIYLCSSLELRECVFIAEMDKQSPPSSGRFGNRDYSGDW